MYGITPLFPGVPGGPELIVILVILILLFGANKIPKLARSSGEAIGEFQKGREEVEQELEDIKDGGGPEGADTTEAGADTGTDSTTDATTEPQTESTTEPETETETTTEE